MARPRPVPPNCRVVDASACVHDVNSLGRVSRGRLDLQAHPAGRTTRATAELDGIAEQVVEDLSQSGRVGPDVARQLGIDKQIERDLFLVGEAAQGIAYAFRERR